MKVNGGATEAMKPLLGNYYQYDGTPVLKTMYREMKECIYVEKDEDPDNLTNPDTVNPDITLNSDEPHDSGNS
ncbi:hypothetical protein AgCh_027860 [Apium graveolens]